MPVPAHVTPPVPPDIPPLDQLRDRFTDYAGGFLPGLSQVDAYNVRLKLDHSLRVLELAREITAREHITGDPAELAHASALFHDTGRFPQYATYKTFSDARSENHARLGVRTLLGNDPRDDNPTCNLLDGFSPRARGLVLGAVALHNRLALPRSVREPLRTPARVVRDADKLDIMPVLLEHLTGEQTPNTTVVLHVASDPEAYTPEMLDAVLERRNAAYGAMRWTNDFKLLLISWVYGLEYRASARLMRERGHLGALLDSLPRGGDMERMRGQVLADLDKLCLGSPR